MSIWLSSIPKQKIVEITSSMMYVISLQPSLLKNWERDDLFLYELAFETVIYEKWKHFNGIKKSLQNLFCGTEKSKGGIDYHIYYILITYI